MPAKGKEAPDFFHHLKFAKIAGDTCSDDQNLEGRRIIMGHGVSKNLPRNSRVDQRTKTSRIIFK